MGSKEKQQEQKKRFKKRPANKNDLFKRGKGGKGSLDDLSTIVFGSIHSDDVGIWAVIMIVIITVGEKNLYLGFM